jgi:hypothetical protein
MGSLCVLCSTLGTATDLRAGDSTEPRAVIRKAIQAMGGEEKLEKYKASVMKGKCRFYGNGRPIECDAEFSQQLPRQIKASYVMHMGDKTMTRVDVHNGDKGWIMMGGKTKPITADHAAEITEGLEALYAATLLPLKNPEYHLSSLGETRIGDRPAIGVKVARQGHRDVLLYFDTEQGYLLKLQVRVKGMDGREVDQETFYSDYQDFDAVRSFKKELTKRDGKVFLETEVTGYKLLEKLPDSVFNKPGG